MSELKNKIAEELDLSVIRYSRVLEDHRILSEALKISPDKDTVLSITSSGENVLNLLLERPKRIVTLDMSPAQNYILELKLVAIQHLSYHDYLVLLGETNDAGECRLAVYEQVKQHLSSHAQTFWNGHIDDIKDSLCICGRLDKFLAKYSWEPLSSTVGEQTFDRLFEAQSLQEQKEIFNGLPLDKLEPILRSLFDREKQKKGRSEAQFKYVVRTEESCEDEAWTNFSHICQEVRIKDNFYHSWIFRGKRGFCPESRPEFAPPCLTEEGFRELKGLIDRVEIHTCTVEAYLSQKDRPQFNKANLSNIFEYMNEEDADQLFTALSDSLAPEGRLAYWCLYNDRLPRVCPELQPLTQMSEDLKWKDRVFYYSKFWVLEKKSQTQKN